MKYSPFRIADALLQMPFAAFVLLAAALGSLLTAFIAQYNYDQHPCVLCIWQRIPFAITIVTMGLALRLRSNAVYVQRLLLLTGIVLLINAGIASFHVGVEQHIWTGTSGCAVTPLKGDVASDFTAADFRNVLLTTEIARCDRISWTFLGFSMATWNVPFSLCLSLFAFLALRVSKTGRKLFASAKEVHIKPIL